MYQTIKQDQTELSNKLNIVRNDLDKLMVSNNTMQDLTNLELRVATLEKNICNNELLQNILNRMNELEETNIKLASDLELYKKASIIDTYQLFVNKYHNIDIDNSLQLHKFHIDIFNKLNLEDKKYYLLNINLNQKIKINNDNYLPIHLICEKSTPEAIKLILDTYEELNLDIECENTNKAKPINIILFFQVSNLEIIKYIFDIYLNKNFNIECVSDANVMPIKRIIDYVKNTHMNSSEKQKYVEFVFDVCIKKNLLEKYLNNIFSSLLEKPNIDHQEKLQELELLLNICVKNNVLENMFDKIFAILLNKPEIKLLKHALDKYKEQSYDIRNLDNVVKSSLFDTFINKSTRQMKDITLEILEDVTMLSVCVDNSNTFKFDYNKIITTELFVDIINACYNNNLDFIK